MPDRDGFEMLQDRWARGDELSPEENAARLGHASVDPLAARELALFDELAGRLAATDDDAPNVTAALARLRGVQLRVVGSAEGSLETPSRTLGRARVAALGVAVLGIAAAALVIVTGTRRPATVATFSPGPTRGEPAPVPATVARSELTFAGGDVSVDGEPAEVGKRTLAEGAKLATRGGRACLKIDPAIDVCLGQESEILLESLAGTEVHVRVARGTAVAGLATRSAGHTFSLSAGAFTASAHGTVFALEANAGRPVRVAVLEGTVEVREPGAEPELIGAHSGLRVGADSARALDAVGRAEEARLFAWLAPRDLAHGSSLGVLEIGEQGSRRALVDEQGPFELPLRAFVSAGPHRVTLRPDSGPDRALDANVEAGGVARVAVREPDTSSAAPSAKLLLEQARDKLAHGDSRGARVLYERLRETHPRSPEAHTVLVALGRLELEAGASERALGSFDAYVKLGGPLVPEALSGRIKALRALGRSVEEARSIEAFLARYPKSFEAPALRKRLESLRTP